MGKVTVYIELDDHPCGETVTRSINVDFYDVKQEIKDVTDDRAFYSLVGMVTPMEAIMEIKRERKDMSEKISDMITKSIQEALESGDTINGYKPKEK